MTIHRFFVPTIEFHEDTIELQGDTAWQISKVLRLESGDVINLFDGSGKEYQVVLERVEKKEVVGRKVLEFTNDSEPKVTIFLYQALLPRETFEHVLQKGTEIGVSTFVPVACTRSIVRAKDVSEDKTLRWKRIVQEAAEQSERAVIPQVEGAQAFTDAITNASKRGTVLVAWENEQSHFLAEAAGSVDSTKLVSLFVGPEGGFTQEEIDFAVQNGAQTVGLGPRILRSETAGPVFAALVLYALEDLSRKRSRS